MASDSAADWVRLSEMLLGKVPDGFTFAQSINPMLTTEQKTANICMVGLSTFLWIKRISFVYFALCLIQLWVLLVEAGDGLYGKNISQQ
ncbi:hypothetical protein RchiOBHm_Chr6g0268471 [Rosa chinensis]|uniref:Uncharacterized protein n=1 Tax=Rosa chinensis TaxID=74649 RepID=A0A2P6PQ68_ROSCH|nr:hypothetical protein RchiOBHm_Chr6g0268471 [Rosa chinensis]